MTTGNLLPSMREEADLALKNALRACDTKGTLPLSSGSQPAVIRREVIAENLLL